MVEMITNLGILVMAVVIGASVDLKRIKVPSYAVIKNSTRRTYPRG